MRRLLVVSLDPFQFHGFHGGGLAQDFLFQPVHQFALRNDHAVQLLDLVFEVGEVGFNFSQAFGKFVVHDFINEGQT